MKVLVKSFASLREQLQLSDTSLELHEGATVADAWQQFTKNSDVPDEVLSAVNHEYCTLQTALSDGDEVAFFPPVTGG